MNLNLRDRIICAPMAGGPSTPELVDALAATGNIGFLPSGSIDADVLAQQMRQVSGRFGVNLFAPQASDIDAAVLAAFVDEVTPEFEARGLDVPAIGEVDLTFGWDAKLQVILEAAVKPDVVSTIFGCFSPEEVNRLHQVGVGQVWATVTCAEDAATAVQAGVDAIIVQGPDAGGHRGTWDVASQPGTQDLVSLVDAMPELPIIAAGGISTPQQVAAMLAHPKVDAVACGTAFMRCLEAGTSDFSRAILAGLHGDEIVTTRAFSGRLARGVATEFTVSHPNLPALYPYLGKLLAPLRRDPKFAYCLAGSGVHQARELPAEQVVAWLAGNLA